MGKDFQTKPKVFSLSVRLWSLKIKEESAEGVPEENPEGGSRLSLGTEH